MNLILDSGAFSAWNLGKEIDLDHYIAYIKANIEYIDEYVNLDVIPASRGVMPTPAEVEASAQKGWDNMLRMEAEGLHPIPVFHMGEEFKWLERMIEHHCTYIGISPANDRTTKDKRLWLDRVFDRITDAEGWPTVKTHAFGVTAVDLLIRYPWYSADSTTWVLSAGRGRVLVPKWKKTGGWDFNSTPITLYLSEPFEGTDEAARIRSLQLSAWRDVPAQRAHVEHWLKDAGSSIELCETDYKERTRVCCFFFQEFERKFVPQPFNRANAHLFRDK